MLEHERHELVARRFVGGLLVRRSRGMDRRRLDVLVTRQQVRVRAVREEHTCRVDVTEEAGEAERVEAVVAERVCA